MSDRHGFLRGRAFSLFCLPVPILMTICLTTMMSAFASLPRLFHWFYQSSPRTYVKRQAYSLPSQYHTLTSHFNRKYVNLPKQDTATFSFLWDKKKKSVWGLRMKNSLLTTYYGLLLCFAPVKWTNKYTKINKESCFSTCNTVTILRTAHL